MLKSGKEFKKRRTVRERSFRRGLGSEFDENEYTSIVYTLIKYEVRIKGIVF
jgi:hypothetical protein